MKFVFYGLGIYFAVVGVMDLVSASSTNSPTADTFSGLPSPGTLFASAGSQTTQGGINLATAAAMFVIPRFI